MYQEGFIIRQVDDTYYAINFKEHILINLNEEGFDVERVKKKSKKAEAPGVPFKKSKKKTLNPIKSLQRKCHQGLGKTPERRYRQSQRQPRMGSREKDRL